jgi:hypothetical protein
LPSLTPIVSRDLLHLFGHSVKPHVRARTRRASAAMMTGDAKRIPKNSCLFLLQALKNQHFF